MDKVKEVHVSNEELDLLQSGQPVTITRILSRDYEEGQEVEVHRGIYSIKGRVLKVVPIDDSSIQVEIEPRTT